MAALMGGNPDEAVSKGMTKVEGRAAALTELAGYTSKHDVWFPIVARPAWKT